jgi:dolichol-phosphate mannosyltransferase
MKITIIIPSYNEKENIEKLVSEIKKIKQVIKIIIVDDSKDGLNEIKSNKVIIINRRKKLGRGSAIIEGINLAIKNKQSDVFIEMDADFSHSPSELPQLIKIFAKKKLDLLIASRYLRNSKISNWGLNRIIFSRFSNILAKILLRIPITDYTNGYRIYSRKSAELISKNCGKIGDGFIVLSEILMHIYYNNYKIDEYKTTFKNRVRGKSSVSIKEIVNSFLGLFKIFFLRKRKYK